MLNKAVDPCTAVVGDSEGMVVASTLDRSWLFPP
jgi:hypothetical protein